jgi:hypothetical protein
MAGEQEQRACYCGRRDCIETYLSGPALEGEYWRGQGSRLGLKFTAEQISRAADRDDVFCNAIITRFEERLARALASVINVLDPRSHRAWWRSVEHDAGSTATCRICGPGMCSPTRWQPVWCHPCTAILLVCGVLPGSGHEPILMRSAPTPSRSTIWLRLFVPFALGYFVSYFLRNANAVIAEDLIRELGLTAADLGLLTGAYLAAFGLAQLPLGLLLDRYGPRRVEASLLLIAAAGCLIFAHR